MSFAQITPFRQMARAYSALLGIHESLRGLHTVQTIVGPNDNKRVDSEVTELRARLAALEGSLDERLGKAIRDHMLLPLATRSADAPFMPFSTCSASDFLHPRYDELCRVINHHRLFHRKLWEWIFILHHLEQAGVLQEGSRGLGFGVGLERLPSAFAARGVSVVATDAPPEIGVSSGWTDTGQHSDTLAQLCYPDLVAEDVFTLRVTHRFEDMTAISDDLTGFDFTWSACCFEHLGSLDAGMDFVANSLKTLKPGGIAVHTTEFNLSSNNRTIDSGATVLYRRRDMEALVERLERDGHQVNPFVVAPDSHFLDSYVDLPPFANEPSLRIKIGEFVTTSVGVVVRKRA